MQSFGLKHFGLKHCRRQADGRVHRRKDRPPILRAHPRARPVVPAVRLPHVTSRIGAYGILCRSPSEYASMLDCSVRPIALLLQDSTVQSLKAMRSPGRVDFYEPKLEPSGHEASSDCTASRARTACICRSCCWYLAVHRIRASNRVACLRRIEACCLRRIEASGVHAVFAM